MKQKKYPLWMLKLCYSRFNSGFSKLKTKNWKELGIDLDGDVIIAKRRFSKYVDMIGIDVINSKSFTIFEKKVKKWNIFN